MFSFDNPIMFMNSVDTEQMMALYNFGQFQDINSNCSSAADYIYHFQVLFTDNNIKTSTHWDIGFAESVDILFKQIIQALFFNTFCLTNELWA